METIKEMLQNKNELITIISGTSVYDAVLFMAEKSVGLVPVMEDGKLIGVFSERDLVKRVIAKNHDLKSTKVNDVMSTQLVIADINEGYESVLTKMKEAKIRHIIVIEDGKSKLTPEDYERLKKEELSWNDLVDKGIIESVSSSSLIRVYSPDSLTKSINSLGFILFSSDKSILLYVIAVINHVKLFLNVS